MPSLGAQHPSASPAAAEWSLKNARVLLRPSDWLKRLSDWLKLLMLQYGFIKTLVNKSVTIRGESQSPKFRDLNDLGSLRVGGSRGEFGTRSL